MKHRVSITVLWIVFTFVLVSKTFAQDPNFQIYLCFGQSNMEGQGPIETQDLAVDSRFQIMQAVNCTGQPQNTWRTAIPPLVRCYTRIGPADYFGREMLNNLPANTRIGVVNVSIGGTKIEIFDKVNYSTYINNLSASDQYIKTTADEYGGNPYARLVELAKLAQQDGVIKGILLHQGEANTGDPTWPSKVNAIYTNLLADLGLSAANVPLLAGEVVDAADGGVCASMNTIIDNLPATIPTAHVISSSGLAPQSDNVHFTTASYRILGARYAQTMLKLLSSPSVNLTAPLNNATYAVGANVTLSAAATDPNGTITNVAFYNGSTLLSTVTSAPYTYTWTNVAEGAYSITAVATDNSGNSSSSSIAAITVGNPKKELISNGEFDNGTVGWSLQSTTNASGTMNVVTNGNLSGTNSLRICPSSNIGTAEWNIQVNGNAPIVAGKSYQISLMAEADASRQILVILQQSTDPYTTYYGQMVNLTTTPQTLTFIYNSTATDPAALLKFGVGANAACVNIDKVSMVEWTLSSTITPAGNTTFCSGGSVVLNANTGANYTYQWNKNGTTITGATTASYTATQSGSYTVAVTANSQTVTSAATTITVNALPTATISTTTPTTFCTGGSVTLNANAGTGLTYKWNNAAGVITGATTSTYSATTAGSYTVTVTNASNCSATSTATTVTVNAAPTATISTTTPTTFCTGGSVTLNANVGTGLTYKWNNAAGVITGATTSTYSATTAGSYTVTVTNANNCSATSTAKVVTVNALPTATISTTTPTTFCTGGSVALNANTGTGLTYKWNNAAGVISGATNVSYTATTAGSYTVEVTNANNCKATSSATTVTVNAVPSAPVVTTPVVYCQNAAATALTATGTALKWYTLSSGGTSAASITPVTTTATTINYYVSQTTNGCESARATIAVAVNALPTAAITPAGPTIFSAGGNVVLNANVDTGLSYRWLNGSSEAGTGSSYAATSSGSYSVEVSNTAGCKATSSITTVTVNPEQPSVITITSPQQNAHTTSPVTITADISDPDGGIVLVEYLDGTTVLDTSTSAPYSFVWNDPAPGSHSLTVRVTDSNGDITTSSPLTFTTSLTTGTQAGKQLSGTVYPVPARDIILVETQQDLSGATFSAVNVLGQELLLSAYVNETNAQLDVSSLSEGTYVLVIRQDSNTLTKRIVVVK